MNITAFDLAQRFVGLKEVPGTVANPAILAMLQLDQTWPQDDDVPWCSAFVNYIAWLLRLPRSKSLLARSWLDVGVPVVFNIMRPEAQVGFDVVIFKRGENPALGHVGFFAGAVGGVQCLGGNQSNSVSLTTFPHDRVLGVRRLA